MGRISFAELKSGITHLFYPLLCEGCNRPLIGEETVLCIGCTTELPETGYHSMANNETALRFAGRFPFVQATSFAYFTDDGLLQHLLHGLKYRGKKDIGTFLGKQFAQSLATTDWLSTIDMIIPVPLHRSKHATRGYNQSHVLSEGIGSAAGIPVQELALKRIRDTKSQTNKTRAERAANMLSAFAVDNQNLVAGKHIMIVDDVLTTGATIEACANALIAVENVKISVATIGIAIS